MGRGPVADMFADHVPVGEMLTEARRELAMRRSVYPKHVTTGRLREPIAERRIRVMEAIIETLEKKAKARVDDSV
jgi:hypothetical protein